MPPDRVSHVVAHIPQHCEKCERPLAASPNDPTPTIHQVAELPRIRAEITEHHGHSRTCPCGHVTRATIPAAVRAHTLGPELTASLVSFSGVHGMTKRGIEETVETLFGVPIALGTISNTEHEVSAAKLALQR